MSRNADIDTFSYMLSNFGVFKDCFDKHDFNFDVRKIGYSRPS